eukprot:jgi/Psemu1/33232/gm1.33232_g
MMCGEKTSSCGEVPSLDDVAGKVSSPPIRIKSHGCGLCGEALGPGEKVEWHGDMKTRKYHGEVHDLNHSCARRRMRTEGTYGDTGKAVRQRTNRMSEKIGGSSLVGRG